MKHIFLALSLTIGLACTATAQQYMTTDGKIKFTSDTPMEKIEAINKSASCLVDAANGNMVWKVLIKGFKFEKALMEEHFNENYMESTKFSNATFSGKITNLSDVKLTTDGTYNATVTGKLKIHGVEKEVTTYGTVTVTGTKIRLNAGFDVAPQDYDISIPAVVKDNIAKTIKVLIDATLEPKK